MCVYINRTFKTYKYIHHIFKISMNAQVTHAIQTQLVTIQLDHSCVHVILAILEMALTAQVAT